MKVGILTSSRADYGIYLPLLQKMEKDSFFEVEIIAFGTHVSKFHGYTLNEIKKDFTNIHTISSLVASDDPQGITTSYGLTTIKFAIFWAENTFDLVFCLGDRFEMSAAVQAGIPFGINFAHIHGGETTLGAIDNIYRHQISLVSVLHFASTEMYAEKIAEIIGTKNNIYTVGALSLDEIALFQPIEKSIFLSKFGIPDSNFALVTFHPETVAASDNYLYAEEMKNALLQISEFLNLVITMPNADMLGNIFRENLQALKLARPNEVILIENFGKDNYFSAMYYSEILIGNTSSGILEAASFGKYVVNVGDRQKGRLQSGNVLDTDFSANDIILKAKTALGLNKYQGENIYYKIGAANQIIKILKSI